MRRSVPSVVSSFAAMAALLFLDGHLGPVSFALRRATALAVLSLLAAARWTLIRRAATEAPCGGSEASSSSENGSDGVPSSREGGSDRDATVRGVHRRSNLSRDVLGWGIAGSLALVSAIAIVARAPSLPVASVGFVIALAAIELMSGRRASGVGRAGGLVPACLCYLAVRFVEDLVPRAGWVAEGIARGGGRYLSSIRGAGAPLSFTALGGPAVGMAVFYLLWGWRRAGGFGRIVAAVAVPLAWFAALPVVMPEVAAGPVAIFARGAYHGLFWLGAAGVLGAILPVRRQGTPGEEGGQAPGCAVSQSPFSPNDGSSAGRRSPVVSRRSMVIAGLAAGMAGFCLVGTAFIGPAAGRSVRVFNHGGLDWDRPEFGRFGAFSGGMFGLWPVYCRAEGYDFDVVDRGKNPDAETTARSAEGASSKAVATTKAGSDGASPSRNSPLAKVEPAAKSGSDGASPSGHPPSASGGTPTKAGPPSKPAAPRKETIEPADLERTQILVLINSPKVWDEHERRVIYDFVERGGSLLVLGDHTDVFGLMRGFNGLLEPLGIKFRFDSAYKARETWRGCQAAAADAVCWGWDDENPGVAVGASLELSGSARPLLVGRYGFSDAGVRENVVGSYLGNYHHDPGEPLGDVVLVATATYGRGRVVVWGDTSAFQGVSSYYPRVVGPILAWLSRPAAWTERPVVRAAAALGLLAAIAWLWLVRGGARESAVIAVGLLVGMIVPYGLGLSHREARVTIADDMVLFDQSHLPATGHYNAKVNPVGPLYTNLLRSGFRVSEMEDWDRAAIARARGIAFIAPHRSFSAAEVKDLMGAEERGAVVILAAGQPDSGGASRLIEAHGFKLLPRPLGTVTSADPGASRVERESHPRFLDAWPIEAADGGNPVELPGVDVIYRHGRDVVALFRRVGEGGLLLIADTRFFSDMNVEDMSGYRPGNLALIHELFRRYLDADPDAVKPLFRSPEKPQ